MADTNFMIAFSGCVRNKIIHMTFKRKPLMPTPCAMQHSCQPAAINMTRS
ncbi:hypothetical protein LHK_02935 [Laribacter hongkongensis HLHK9]|uniref:Uncharacterized protein n=2 Tax=Laribacter hongkongensis TaxID=168471 RepID=C1D4X2_LARHH|nr:hypothetical protein LHK_02935 [Laribacter hongkongensis HLHK9]ASJ25940.1 hypothetical protein LHGZ1_3109 [Laribacter hongkongensis]